MHDHPASDAIVAFADGDTAGIDASAIADHVSQCDGCARTVAELRRVRSSIYAAAQASPTPPHQGNWADLAARIDAHRFRHRLIRRLAGVAAAASLLTVAALLRHQAVERRREEPVVAMHRVVQDIDNAIRETRAALASDPADAGLRNHLAALQRKRVSAQSEITSLLRDRS